jgi:transglutaminase-like putative cysteine protease
LPILLIAELRNCRIAELKNRISLRFRSSAIPQYNSRVASGEKLDLISILTPPAARQPATVRNTIEQYFQVSLFLLVTTGFVTLTTTGRLDSVSLVSVSAALLLRAYLMLRGRTLQIPERWTSYLTLVYVLFYAADIFLVSGSYVDATVHLVLFIMVVKIFSVQRDRDHLYLAILSFLEVLAAAVLTVDTVFLGAFGVFMLLAVATFISMEMKRSAAAASHTLPAPALPNPSRRMMRSLSGIALLITASVVVGATAIFFILPRLSAGYLSAYAPRNEFVSGFSDRVQLGEIGRIKQSDTVVMHIEIEGDRGAYAGLKWRGVALALFDGKEWKNPVSNTMEAFASSPRNDPEVRLTGMGRYNLARAQTNTRNLPADRGDVRGLRPILYKVLMEPIGTNVLFLAPVPISVQGRIMEIGVDENGAVYNLDRSRMTESYSAASLWGQPSAEQLRRPGGTVPNDITMVYRQLPPRVDRRVTELAQQITAGAGTDHEKASAIESYLRSHYGYSLQMATTPPPDPLAYFLFERKEGHCEYFASAMAIMLRTLGIPARIVNGFHGGEYNDLTGSYIVRGRDAHSWVEAYIPGYAWVSFDPTPADPAPVVGNMHRFLLYLDAAREFWREWVINYDFLHQRTLTITAMAHGRTAGDRARTWLRSHYQGLLARARRVHREAERAPRTWAMGALLAMMLCVLLANATRIWRAAHRRRVARNPVKSPDAAASIWYARMTRSVGRKGFPKKPAQTPREFVASIADQPLQTSVASFTRHYERARFGKSPKDAARLPEIFEEIKAK